ncbi:MAG TPA: D-aminoacylase [Gemmatimonadales bacterium]|jgi:dihydroorotase/N-acyl-D-amino-acid deacylase|nr:D-aminoacylase [Gemmatimonadales bacterium]
MRILFSSLLVVAAAGSTGLPLHQVRRQSGAQEYEVVIANGRIVDGSGNPWFYGDVAISGDRIARVTPAGMLRDAPARQRIEARGLVIAPGIIDIQAQSYPELLAGDSRVVSMVTQGITTMILGEGDTPAPANEKLFQTAAATATDTALQRAMRGFTGPRGFDSWLRAMEKHTASVNFGSFLGAGTVRAYAKGMTEGPPNAAELDTMRRVVRDAMLDGAFGVGSALIYPPGSYATTAELIEEARAMAPFGGVYITHMRSEGDRLVEALDEAIRIGKEGGVPVEIYHLKAAGVRNWPKAAQVVAKIDSARAAGQDVATDQYPYVAGQNNLSSCIPPWAHADGKLLDRLRDPATRAKVRTEMTSQHATFESLCLAAGPAGIEVVGFTVDSLRKYEGKRLTGIAQARREDWPDAVINLTLAEQNKLGQVIFIASDSNVAMQVRKPWMKFGTDAEAFDPDSAKIATHPRAYGTYPRILGRFVREQRILTLEDAVRKMTSAVAGRLSIPDRGQIREGMYADVMVFDPNTIIDRATYEKPHQLSEGVKYVLVNGVAVVSDGKVTGAKPGRIVRGPGWKGG